MQDKFWQIIFLSLVLFRLENGLSKAENGWRASRVLKRTEKCEFHYIWENAVITEKDSE